MLEEIIERVRPLVDLQAGPRQSEALHPILGMYVLLTIPTLGAVLRT